MPAVLKVDSKALWEKGNVTIESPVPGLCNIQVCCGSGGWPTPYEVGVYLDTNTLQSCIINWPRPCAPIKFGCDYGEFVFHLDNATEQEILAATEVKAEFFRAD